MNTSQVKFSVIVGMTVTALIIITSQYAFAADASGSVASSGSALPNTTSQLKTAAPQPAAEADEVSDRMAHPWGAYVSLAGDPAPTLVGLNAAYNLTDFLRVHAGFGQVSMGATVTTNGDTVSTNEISMTTIGAGALALVPGWSFSPVLGFSYSHVSYNGDGSISVPSNNIYGTVGLDWQSQSGLNIGFGLNQGMTDGTPSGGYLNIGWFI